MDKPPSPKRGSSKSFRLSRDIIVFMTGLLGVVHETVIANTERPGLLLLFAAMMGLPLYLRGNGL